MEGILALFPTRIRRRSLNFTLAPLGFFSVKVAPVHRFDPEGSQVLLVLGSTFVSGTTMVNVLLRHKQEEELLAVPLPEKIN